MTGCKLVFGIELPLCENRFQAHFNRISAKDDENRPSLILALLLLGLKYQHRKIVSSCLAGRFSVVLRAGSWPDLHHRVWRSVRLFLCLEILSYVLTATMSSSRSSFLTPRIVSRIIFLTQTAMPVFRKSRKKQCRTVAFYFFSKKHVRNVIRKVVSYKGLT